MLALSLLMTAAQQGASPQNPTHVGDRAPVIDAGRPVYKITRTGFSLQYATSAVCETKILLRAGNLLSAVTKSGSAPQLFVTPMAGASLPTRWHHLQVTGLKPGTRYFYQVYDPEAKPTDEEARWGAKAPWSEEYAVNTLAPTGRKTIIHLPVKVLLMPNVISVASAVQPDGSLAPEPTKVTAAQIARIESEYARAARFFWVSSGMRLWVDFKFVVDDRWQKWGPEASATSPFYQNLPSCRLDSSKDDVNLTEGEFVGFDLKSPLQSAPQPIPDGIASQFLMAWPRRWDPAAKSWKFYPSVGQTLGGERWPAGFPATSALLAGSDTAWLVASHLQNQLASYSPFLLANREDDRIVAGPQVARPVARHRFKRGDGTQDMQAWSTAGVQGQAWDGLRYWVQQLTDAQWLRFSIGFPETVLDKDGDGVPDADPRLPLDAKRLGSAPLATAMERDWVTVPLQSSWLKDQAETSQIDPNPVLLPIHPALNADPAIWESVPVRGRLTGKPLQLTYQEAYDERGYYGFVQAKGALGRLEIDFDGEGKGLYGSPGALGFTVESLNPAEGQAGPVVLPVAVKPTFGGVGGKTPWLAWKARQVGNALTFEFRIENQGDSPWFWTGAGHEVGLSLRAFLVDGRGYSVGVPYRLTYAPMVESRGRRPMPLGRSEILSEGAGVQVHPVAQKTGVGLPVLGLGWKFAGGEFVHAGASSPLLVTGLKAGDFDLAFRADNLSGLLVGGWGANAPRPDRDSGYVGEFVNGASVRVFGTAGDPGPSRVNPRSGASSHDVQFSRRGGWVWMFVDGAVVSFGFDPTPGAFVNRLGVVADGDAKLTDLRYVNAP